MEQTDNFVDKMELQGAIEDLEIKHGLRLPPKPIEREYECVGCSS